ncbi:MAG: hypothetical protein QOF78_3007 [Phycisphaerales bacterium]|jgi:hypothetical protein|nr:hypothetical protein [Phycisphaerales bacterium]
MTNAMTDLRHPLPPSDPLRPLALAIRSTRLLGFCSAVFGLVFLLAFGYLNPYRVYAGYGVAMGLIIWFIPGVLLMTCALQLHHRRRGAAVGALIITGAHALFAIAALVGSCTLSPVSPIPIIMSVLWVASTIQLIVHLRRSLPLLAQDAERRKGFEVRMKRNGD